MKEILYKKRTVRFGNLLITYSFLNTNKIKQYIAANVRISLQYVQIHVIILQESLQLKPLWALQQIVWLSLQKRKEEKIAQRHLWLMKMIVQNIINADMESLC